LKSKKTGKSIFIEFKYVLNNFNIATVDQSTLVPDTVTEKDIQDALARRNEGDPVIHRPDMAVIPATPRGTITERALENIRERESELAGPLESSESVIEDDAAEAIAEAAGDVPTDLVASVPDTSTPSVNPPDGIPDDVAYAEPVKPPKRGEAVVGEKLFAIVGDCELEAKGEPLSAATRIKGMSKGDLVALWMAVAERLDARFLAAAPELSKAKPSAVGVFKRDVLKAEITELAQYLAGCSDDELAGRAPQAPANAENATLEVGVSGDEDAASEPETREEILGGTKPAASSEPVDLANRALRAARTLYIDCAPRKTDVVFFSDLVRPFALAAAKELGVVSYRVPQYKRGEDNVVARLEVAIGDGSLVLPENLVVETSIPSARICLEILIPAYDRVVERLGW